MLFICAVYGAYKDMGSILFQNKRDIGSLANLGVYGTSV